MENVKEKTQATVMLDIQERLKREVKEAPYLKIISSSSGTSIQMFKKNPLAHTSKKIMWIREETKKITCILYDRSYETLVKNMGFAEIHPIYGQHFAGCIREVEDE